MSALLIWLGLCGLVVNAFFALFALKALYHLGWAFCAAFSRCRFSYAVGRAHGFRKNMRFWPWIYWPKYLMGSWWEFICEPRGSSSMHGSGGYWNGIGNWKVYPVRQQAEGE